MPPNLNLLCFLFFQVMWPRTTSSLIRAVFLQFTTLFVFIALQSFNPLHPLTWISTSIGLLITPTSWFYDLIAIVTVTGIGLFYSSQVSLFPWIPKNHLANFTRCFLPQVGTGYFFMKICNAISTIQVKKWLILIRYLQEMYIFFIDFVLQFT